MREILTFEGQEVEYFVEKKILKLNIKEPFHSAGNQYHWNGDPEGIGINEKIIKFASKQDANLLITIGEERVYYWIEAWIVESFSENTKSFYKKKTDKSTINLYVFPFSRLNCLHTEPNQEVQAVL
jgi:hypothetical protein